MKTDMLRAIQHHNARVAIGSSSMRGAGSAGVVDAARAFLGKMPLRAFSTSSSDQFLSRLDTETDRLKAKLPEGARHWGLARKGLNIFLRDCLYTFYLRTEFDLATAEMFFELPLDSITGKRLVQESDTDLPRWNTVRGLDPKTSANYQAAAAALAVKEGFARVHLDAIWWGERPNREVD